MCQERVSRVCQESVSIERKSLNREARECANERESIETVCQRTERVERERAVHGCDVHSLSRGEVSDDKGWVLRHFFRQVLLWVVGLEFLWEVEPEGGRREGERREGERERETKRSIAIAIAIAIRTTTMRKRHEPRALSHL